MRRNKEFNSVEKLGQYILKSNTFAKSNKDWKVDLCNYATWLHKEYVYLLNN